MSTLDWVVLFSVLVFIVVYGVWKSKKSRNIEGYLLGDKSLPWWSVCVSIMATQASAITFLSTPGQAYEDGMRFLQFYFGLPLAMIILSITAVPLYHKLKVYTAYEYLESRFDVRVRSLAAFLFLMLRGLSVGITIYAPSLILSTVLGWDIHMTTVFIGVMVMVYTVSGGTRAVSMTQTYQLSIVMIGMLAAGFIAFRMLPHDITFSEAFQLAGEMGKLNLVNLSFDLTDRYNVWSGLIGGLFLFLSYFGADQSQVGRYLGGKSVGESRLGLIFNGLLKVPMQFVILYIGVLVFVFYQFHQAPVFYNQVLKTKAANTAYAGEMTALESAYGRVSAHKQEGVEELLHAMRKGDAERMDEAKRVISQDHEQASEIRGRVKEVIASAVPGSNTVDRDYIFIHFVMAYLPHGLIGLLLAVVFSAAMASTASELNALASTTAVDIYKRSVYATGSDYHYVKASKWFTAGWAVFGMIFASIANQAENLIQFVNIIGSLFYGTILGIFLSAFYMKYIHARAVFIAAVVSELVIVYCYFFTDIAYLLYNIIGCVLVVGIGFIVQLIANQSNRQAG